MKIPAVSNRAVTIPAASLRAFARHLTTAPGFHQLASLRSAAADVVDSLLAQRIENVMVSKNANPDVMVEQIERVLGVKEFTSPFLAEPSLLFNVPEMFQAKGAMLFTEGEVHAEADSQSWYLELSIEDVRAGLTDFGEDVLSFMELNGVKSIKIINVVLFPRYAKNVGFSGAIGERLFGGKALGDFPKVSGWTTFSIEIDPARCSPSKDPSSSCRACVVVCPAGAIDPGSQKKMYDWGMPRIMGGKSGIIEEESFRFTIDPNACKGCRLCVDACGSKAISVFEGRK